MAIRKKKDPRHYVDNKKLFEEMKKFKELCYEAEESGEERPPVSHYIGECFLKIANGLSFRPNFVNYTYKQDMVSDGIENCLQYLYNFDPKKSNNPFAYFTQIIYYAFIRRIQKEKKQTHIKHKLIEKSAYITHTQMPGDDTAYSIQGFDPTIMLPDEPVYKTKEKNKDSGLSKFMKKNKK
jgi:hypothetical protein